jgi:hypothetical protein
MGSDMMLSYWCLGYHNYYVTQLEGTSFQEEGSLPGGQTPEIKLKSDSHIKKCTCQ